MVTYKSSKRPPILFDTNFLEPNMISTFADVWKWSVMLHFWWMNFSLDHWSALKPESFERIRIPGEAMECLPNLIEGKNGDVYIIHADFICPDDCPEPGIVCYVTGQKRKRNMFDLLNEIKLPEFHPIVVRSHQLAPGVGGYRPEKLFQVLQQISETKTAILLSTACRCHGVITGVISKKHASNP